MKNKNLKTKTKIQNYKTIIIGADSSETKAFHASVLQRLRNGWTSDLHQHHCWPRFDKDAVTYICTKRGKRPVAALFILRRDDFSLFVANIVPRDTSRLSPAQYNRILLDFQKSVLAPLVGFSISQPTTLFVKERL